MSNEPMSIVLVGAPGSRKTAVSEVFLKLADEAGLGPFTVIDDVAKSIEADYDRPIGIYGTYVENLMVYSRRYELEQVARGADENFITVGSVIETMAHGAQNVELLAGGITAATPDAQKRVMREAHATTTLSFLFLDTFRYTYGFYLPLPEKVVLPSNIEQTEDSFNQAIDNNIKTIFGNFGLGLQEMRGSTEEIAKNMVAAILKLEAEKVESQKVAAKIEEEEAGVEA